MPAVPPDTPAGTPNKGRIGGRRREQERWERAAGEGRRGRGA